MYNQQRLKKVALMLMMSMLCLISFAQERQVQGIVKDKSGEPMIGVNVLVKGTTNGTITGVDGDFTLSGVKKSDILSFTYIGFKNKELKYEGEKLLNVVLEEDSELLDEVVVIGYGTVNKRDLTGSVASVSSQDIASIPVSSASEALTGKMAGVNITTTEGSPDADIKIRIRGGGSLSQDNSPLYIVDGFPVSSISDIAPSEIQSIDVLKDASSTAIYGARGANGVIIVTTKSGKEGKVQVDFGASFGFKKVTKMTEVMSPYDFVAYQREIGSLDYGNYNDMDIWKSIDVLKDASSTAIYGARGANGVIIVTTKSGKEGKVSVSYNAYYAWKKVAKTLDVLSASDYTKWQYELAQLTNKNDDYIKYFGNYQDLDMYDNVATNDWQDLTFGRTGHSFNHNLSINGGSDKFKYSFSYSHIDDKAIMQMSDYARDNLNLKLNHKPLKNVSLDFSARFSKTKINGGGSNDANSSLNTDKRLKYSLLYTPYPVPGISDALNADEEDANSLLINPLISLRDNDTRKERINYNLAGSITWEIIKDLKLKAEVGYDDYRNNADRYYGVTTYYVRNNVDDEDKSKPAISFTRGTRTAFRSTNTLSYDFKKFFKNNKNHLNLLAGQEYIVTRERELRNVVHGFPTEYTADDCINYSTKGNPYEVTNYGYPDDVLFSFFGRANYDFDSKYLFSATFRADGSSKFAKGNQWGFFPSAAVAWRISSESFMENTKNWLDDLKLRFSYGTAGNNNIPSGQISQLYELNKTPWINGVNSYIAPSKYMANSDLTWETTITRNVGLDFTTLGGRLSGTIEGYWNNTKDLLIMFPTSGTGYNYQYRNMGETENKGLEASVNWVAVDKKNFGLSIGANISFNKNKIKSLGSLQKLTNEQAQSYWASTEIGQDFLPEVGGSVGKMYGYVSAGRYEVSDFESYDATTDTWTLKKDVNKSSAVGTARPGMMKLKDLDNSGDANGEKDKTIIGDANPLHTGGFNINARLYGFDLAANFTWSYGNDIYNANKIETTSTSKYLYRNMTSEMSAAKRWTNIDGNGNLVTDMNQLAQMNENTTMWSPYMSKFVFSDWAVEDGSYLRLSTLTLGYTLPVHLTKKVGINNLRFYVTGYNLFCITGYSGYDPEVSTCRRNGSQLTPGVDYSAYPKSRQFVIGLNLNF